MANVEGNEIALRQVASELFPPVRSGQDARTNQDNFGTPFTTLTYVVNDTYEILDPITGLGQAGVSFAPSWVYGLLLEPSWGGLNETSRSGSGVDAPRYYASFGTTQKTNEVEITPGKVLSFPRGARRVFLRSNTNVPSTIRVTWIVDRFASISNSGADGVDTCRTWFGDGTIDTISVVAQPVSQLIAQLDGYTNFCCFLENNLNQPLSYELSLFARTIDSGTVPVGAVRLVSYGPGVGNLAGVMVGHGIVIPAFGSVRFDVSSVAATGSVAYSWRGV